MPERRIPLIRAALAAAALLLAGALAPATSAGSGDFPALDLPTQVFDLHDPDGDVRRAVGYEDAERNLRRLRERTPAGADAEETVQLAVGAARSLRWGDVEPMEVGRWTMLAAAQIAVDRHPDAARGLNEPIDRPSPIEEYCNCVGRGAHACGCELNWYGSGACEYTMDCSWFAAWCNVVSIQACIARGGTDIIRPWR